mmetsp:Transcript_17844/g.37265  ORF Transcript_17844/g.37265 Transcript_17844/m.37265 type:complete len:108 (+) Transcript_17844:133-456(+)
MVFENRVACVSCRDGIWWGYQKGGRIRCVCVCVCVSNEKNQCEWLETYYTWSPITVHATYKHIISKKSYTAGFLLVTQKRLPYSSAMDVKTHTSFATCVAKRPRQNT